MIFLLHKIHKIIIIELCQILQIVLLILMIIVYNYSLVRILTHIPIEVPAEIIKAKYIFDNFLLFF
jgi:hypothetical protein